MLSVTKLSNGSNINAIVPSSARSGFDGAVDDFSKHSLSSPCHATTLNGEKFSVVSNKFTSLKFTDDFVIVYVISN